MVHFSKYVTKRLRDELQKLDNSSELNESETAIVDNKNSASYRKPHRRWRIAIIVITLLLCALTYIGVFGGNVREVVPGKLYRSAQLTGNGYDAVSAGLFGNSLDSVIKRYGIKTVLNLRGGSEKDKRYRDELAVCSQDGTDHIDDAFSARALPSPEVVARLFDVFDHAKYPILIHCQAGADRTGLACAVYANAYLGQPIDTAETNQLTWRYGHFKFTNTRPMNKFFDLYRETSKGKSLREWAKADYPKLYDGINGSR